MDQKEYGNVGAGIPSDRPEIKDRQLEVDYFILTKDQTEYYLKVGRSIELRRWKSNYWQSKELKKPSTGDKKINI